MIKLTGIIKMIDIENNNGNDKVVLTLSPQTSKGLEQIMFIEFQGKYSRRTLDVKVSDLVQVSVLFNGKISALGRRYNNIIGIHLEKI